MSFDEIYKKRIENKCNISVPKKLYNTLIHKINDLDGQIRNHSIVINQMSEIIEEINNSMNEEMNNKISEITSQIELIDDKAKTIDSMAFGPQWRHSKFIEDADAVSYSQLSVIHRIDH